MKAPKRWATCVVLSTLGGAVAASGAAAQGRGVDVPSMPSRAYNVGVPAGQFTILPELRVSGTYDDNVFRTQSNKKDDVYGTVTPRVAIRSNWARHAVGAGASASVRRYSRHTSEDHETYSANLVV
jgi:hypothetical protein